MTWRAIFGRLYGEAKAYIPKSRFPKELGVMTKGYVIQMIREIGQTKMILEAAGENTEMLPEFLYGFMLRKYGLVKLAENHIVEFLASCSKHKFESPRILMFCRFLVRPAAGQIMPAMTKCAKPLTHLVRLSAKSSKWSVLIGRAGRLSTTFC